MLWAALSHQETITAFIQQQTRLLLEGPPVSTLQFYILSQGSEGWFTNKLWVKMKKKKSKWVSSIQLAKMAKSNRERSSVCCLFSHFGVCLHLALLSFSSHSKSLSGGVILRAFLFLSSFLFLFIDQPNKLHLPTSYSRIAQKINQGMWTFTYMPVVWECILFVGPHWKEPFFFVPCYCCLAQRHLSRKYSGRENISQHLLPSASVLKSGSPLYLWQKLLSTCESDSLWPIDIAVVTLDWSIVNTGPPQSVWIMDPPAERKLHLGIDLPLGCWRKKSLAGGPVCHLVLFLSHSQNGKKKGFHHWRDCLNEKQGSN